jgi:hypothetical protein
VYNVKSFHVLHSRIENIAVISGSQWLQACTFHIKLSAFYVHLVLFLFFQFQMSLDCW